MAQQLSIGFLQTYLWDKIVANSYLYYVRLIQVTEIICEVEVNKSLNLNEGLVLCTYLLPYKTTFIFYFFNIFKIHMQDAHKTICLSKFSVLSISISHRNVSNALFYSVVFLSWV